MFLGICVQCLSLVPISLCQKPCWISFENVGRYHLEPYFWLIRMRPTKLRECYIGPSTLTRSKSCLTTFVNRRIGFNVALRLYKTTRINVKVYRYLCTGHCIYICLPGAANASILVTNIIVYVIIPDVTTYTYNDR